ncbi:hypothetical protein FLW53_09315 [Microbispora sp. SCL1-1]|uniref:hypothetical protein n=1 Tax=unclassified Microbispora TaxID=2614687 RepID=UPI0011597F18|nr:MULTISPECIES: hypothetical protein [unclassified Microbispora]NJP24397.1 hypothetical protein [Microbispora sp. CL1-1]TQS14551.1 hypothetical protein FLW53_09315 [Microbispora sp. SCL1-1]
MLRTSERNHRPETTVETTTPLDATMNARRIELGLSWDEIAAKAGVSTAFLREYRKGRKGARDLTRALLEDALKWKRGSLDALAAGGQPEPADEIPTIGELLVQHGVATEDELTDLEDHRDAKVMEVLAADDMTPQAAADFLKLYMLLRRKAFGRA